MIDRAYVQRMARYNRWQNENLYGVADLLSDDERRRERGAFFGSIHKTLSHLLWGDQIWMSRFTDTPKPKAGIPGSVSLFPGWAELTTERAAFDQTMIDWADLPPIRLTIRPPRSGSGRGRDGCSLHICSIIKHTIAGRCIAC